MTAQDTVPPKARIVCVGHTAFDRVYRVAAWPQASAKVRALAYRESGGGMAANAAAAIATLGGEALFWGPAGDDGIATAMSDELQRLGVDVRGLARIPGTQSSHSAILVDAQGERLIVGVRGAVLTAGAEWLPLDELDRADAVLADVRWPLGARTALLAARKRGVHTILDADVADERVLSELVAMTRYVVFSQPGLLQYAGSDRPAGLRRALDQGAQLAAVTRGAEGVEWVDAGEPSTVHHLAAHPIDAAVDTTGAGDVFHGAFALAISEGRPAAAALAFASVAAALKCTREGARSVPERAQIEAILRTC